ncbi:TetR family transcriptional regulator [Rhodococcus sp. IITR03]|nr:TetR family transcriptional regulator [Rhodococcus sp. IITR03]
MRADAAKRRQLIVQEARRLFAVHGSDVALEAVAEAAGVGIATLYRNFESRAALADEVALTILADMRAAGTPGPGARRCSPEVRLGGLRATAGRTRPGRVSATLAEFVTDEISESVRDARRRRSRVEELLDAVRSAGIVRPDLDALELVLAIGLITRPLPDAIRAVTPDLVPRLVSIVLAGMRPS